MKQLLKENIIVPAHCLPEQQENYVNRFLAATKNTGNLMLFAGDQKIEHLNNDFEGEGIHPDDNDPEHLFRIAQKGDVGVFAAQHGIISRYGPSYPDVRYLVKMNSKTGLVSKKQMEPISQSLVDFSDVLELRDSGLDIIGIGYTIYLGSENEAYMLSEAGRFIAQAHRHGLLAVLWMYPRGAAVKHEHDPKLIAGAAGVACSLGADFVKVSAPKHDDSGDLDPELLQEATRAAGRTGVIASGGSAVSPEDFLTRTKQQIELSHTRGSATGRNIHQHDLATAVRMCKALNAICTGSSAQEAIDIFKNHNGTTE
jgi:DhnA family fructose-bisphosphate aldolase class Ia